VSPRGRSIASGRFHRDGQEKARASAAPHHRLFKCCYWTRELCGIVDRCSFFTRTRTMSELVSVARGRQVNQGHGL
jgi:hypothetical protein